MSRKKRKRKRHKALPRKIRLTKTRGASQEFRFDVDSKLERALKFHQSGQTQKAEKICKEILRIDPTHSGSLHLLGVIAYRLGSHEMAVDLMNKAIQNSPSNPVYYNNLALPLREQGKLDEAIACYQKAVELKPDLAEAYGSMGSVFHLRGMLSEAISCYKKTLELEPGLAEVYNNMGSAFKNQGNLDKAMSCYRKAVQLRPDYAEAYNNMGGALEDYGNLDKAMSCYQKALDLKPGLAEPYNNMGRVFQEQGTLNEAMSCYSKALELKPELAEAYKNMGTVFEDQGSLNEAISCYRKALKLRPGLAEAYGLLAGQLQQTCAWHELEAVTTKLDAFTEEALDSKTKPSETPFASVVRHPNLSRNFAIAKLWSRDITKLMSNLKMHFSFDDRRLGKTKIVVGYLSNDFHDHPTAHLMLSLFRLHNRNEFEILCYSYGVDDGSYYRARIEQDCDKFLDIRDLSHADAAKRIYEDRVDILVDLKGYTMSHRLGICALRPAPIQVSYLGFPGTTGADFIDYIITDKIVTPENHAPYYSENFVYLPHCYQVNDHTQAISKKAWKIEDFGAPAGSFVLCSFNSPYKVDRTTFDVWMKILQQVPQGVLWLLRGNESAEENLRREAEVRHVKAERLIFAQTLPKDEHLARLRLADLSLDTGIVNGHTTTSDALWAGVPVVTLQGSHFASRVSASILTAIGLPELVAHSLDDYEALVVRLAHNPDELEAIRERLARNRLAEPLFDTPRFVGNLEKAYKEMWQIVLAREKPRQIEVVEN
jgi:protein O-GlcNAc transferase